MLRQIKWIALSQLSNLILPLVLIPVLAHKLGLGKFASFAILTGISQYATLGVELGLNHAGLADMNKLACFQERRMVFSEIFYLKIVLAIVVCASVVTVASYSKIIDMANIPTLILFISGSLLTCIVYPAWFFILAGRMDVNFKISFISRMILTVLCLAFVSGPDDYLKAIAFFNFAMIPLALVYARLWIHNVVSPQKISLSRLKLRLLSGFALSSVMLRETITNIGVAPVYGMFVLNNSVGLFVFAEKIAKLITIPAPLVTSTLMVSSEKSRVFQLQSFLVKKKLWVLGLAAILAMFLMFAVTVEFVVRNYFPAYIGSIPFIYILAVSSPIVYFNYIEVGMRYTKHGLFGLSGRFSIYYIIILLLTSIFLAGRYGSSGLAVATIISELMLMAVLINRRKRNG